MAYLHRATVGRYSWARPMVCYYLLKAKVCKRASHAEKQKKRKATQDASKTVRRAYLRKIDDCYFWKYKIFIATFIR